MTKLKLNLDALRVDSFQTAEPAEERGTVNGAAAATYGQWTCGIYCKPTINPAITGPCAC